VEENITFEVKKKENELKDLINKNYDFREDEEMKKNLMHNFHWVIMRGRRMKHLTKRTGFFVG